MTILLALISLAAAQQMVPFAEVSERALAQSKLTLPGSPPFHLKAHIEEMDSPGTDIKADFEIFWAAPDRWRRVIKSEDFTQTKIVNGDRVSEANDGDYYPAWLRNMVNGLLTEYPGLDVFTASNATIRKPGGGSTCARATMVAGVPPVQNNIFYNVCFEGKGLVENAFTPGYGLEFQNYKPFKDKRVARLLVAHPESGDEIRGTITELSELRPVDESLFVISDPTPSAKQIRSIAVKESLIRSMILSPVEIVWPPVRAGKTSGVLSLYVWIDRTGAVREVHGLNSDHPEMTDAAATAVKSWKFKPGIAAGDPVQLETILTFAYDTKVENPVVILPDAEGRKLAKKMAEPAFPRGIAPSGTSVIIRVSLSAEGKLMGAGDPKGQPIPLFLAAYEAIKKWEFSPYLKDGKPDLVKLDIVFRVP